MKNQPNMKKENYPLSGNIFPSIGLFAVTTFLSIVSAVVVFGSPLSEIEERNRSAQMHALRDIVIGILVMGVIAFIIVKFVRKRKANAFEIKMASEKFDIVQDDNLTVYSKLSKSSDIIVTLHKGEEFFVDQTSDFGNFYKVVLKSGQTGYIDINSKFWAIN